MILKVRLLSDKLLVAYNLYPVETIAHYCPACGVLHGFAIQQPFENNAIWEWNEQVFLPTFKPDMDIKGMVAGQKVRCHYKLINGVLWYEKDCTHQYANHKGPLPGIPMGLLRNAEIIRDGGPIVL